MENADFEGRVAIVTGAWRGLGRAAAARLHDRGALVAVNNEAVLYGEVPPWVHARRMLEMKLLPDFLKGYIGKTTFSFNAFARNRANSPAARSRMAESISRKPKGSPILSKPRPNRSAKPL